MNIQYKKINTLSHAKQDGPSFYFFLENKAENHTANTHIHIHTEREHNLFSLVLFN